VAGGGGAAGGGGSAGASGVDCTGYCDLVMANCTGGDAQYANKADCLAVCASFPAGSPNDQSGNSFYCRNYHAGNATSNPSVHCPHAGPAGDGVCGSNCDGYCNIMMKHCSSVSGAYTSLSDCTTKCAGITGATSTSYDTGNTSGDSLFCRIYHATVASTNPTVHCPHSIETPTAQCI